MKIPSKWDAARLFASNKVSPKPKGPKPDADLKGFMPGHILNRPTIWRAGVIFASPHSGNIYPDSFINSSQLTLAQLRRNEDIFIDKLFAPAIVAGAPLLTARFPRCFVDVNRAADEIPQKWSDAPLDPSARTHAGIGVIPTHINEAMPIYQTEPSQAQAMARIHKLYDPYHNALRGIIDESLNMFGAALLIDCHSMPGFAPMGSRRPDIVLGDRFGKSCQPETLAMFKALFVQAGYSVAINHPYAGGYVTTHYGQLKTGVEAIQIEINRDLYLNPTALSPNRGYDELAENLKHIIPQIIQAASAQNALAAQ